MSGSWQCLVVGQGAKAVDAAAQEAAAKQAAAMAENNLPSGAGLRLSGNSFLIAGCNGRRHALGSLTT